MVTKADYKTYQDRITASIKELIEQMGCRPVLFLGCGISRRYLGSPNWMDLLRAIAKTARITDARFNFLAQQANNDAAQLGTLLIDPVHKWSWGPGKSKFPKEYFAASADKAIFLKHVAAQHLLSFGPLTTKNPHAKEIDLFKKTSPHAMVVSRLVV